MFPTAVADAATGNAMMAHALRAFDAACRMMITAAPLADGTTLPDDAELAELLKNVRIAIERRHTELDANDGGREE